MKRLKDCDPHRMARSDEIGGFDPASDRPDPHQIMEVNDPHHMAALGDKEG
jgi:hypothetical protein